MLVANGADEVFIDDGHIAKEAKKGERFDKIIDLVGTTTLEDLLQCARENGIVCMAGIVESSWTLPNFHPHASDSQVGSTLQRMLVMQETSCDASRGVMPAGCGREAACSDWEDFKIDEIVEAHKCMRKTRLEVKS